MRIPPYFQHRQARKRLAVLILGIIIGWFFFIFQYGQVYENLIFELSKQTAIIKEQEEKIEQLRSEQYKLNEENKQKLTVQQIEIFFLTQPNRRFNQLTLFELRQQAINELHFIERKNIETVALMKDLMISTIENKQFTIDEQQFQLYVKEVYLFTTLQLYVDVIEVKKL